MTQAQSAPVHVLWTGGWDSSWRVLDLAVNQRRMVQPHYVRRDARKSNAHELAAMAAIRASVLRRHGAAAAGRIAPTIVGEYDARDIPQQLRDWHQTLRAQYDLSQQYIFLNGYARAAGLDALELGVVRSDTLSDFLMPYLLRDAEGWALVPAPALPAMELFRPFRYALLDVTKPEITRLALRSGCLGELRLTHFCANPAPDGRPCGKCYPCKQTVAQGLGWRMPLGQRLRRLPVVGPWVGPVMGALRKAGLRR